MNSAEILSRILASDEMKAYQGYAGISFPFCLKDGSPAVFLYLESDKKESLYVPGLFIGKECRFQEDGWAPQQDDRDLIQEIANLCDDNGDVIDIQDYIEILEKLYGAFNILAESVFMDANNLTKELFEAAVCYLETMLRFSDIPKRVCYSHYAGDFLNWCLDLYYYTRLTE